MQSIIDDMRSQEINDFAEEAFGINLYSNDPDSLPQDEDELALHMQLSYKQAVELSGRASFKRIDGG